MTKIYDESYEDKPIAELRYSPKALLFSPATIVFGIATFGLYFAYILLTMFSLSHHTYVVYPHYIHHKNADFLKKNYNYQYEMIERIDVSYTFFDRMFGTGTIKLKMKGMKFWSNVYMEKIGDVEKAVAIINTAMNRHKQNIGMR